MMSPGAETAPATARDDRSRPAGGLRIAWRVCIFLTVITGMLHLVNVVGWGRIEAGPFLLTPFRFTFVCSWLLLVALLLVERRLLRPGAADLLVLFLAGIFLVRALFEPDTASIALNWLSTAAGLYFLLRLGIRDKADVKVILYAIVTGVLIICLFGLAEYVAKSNPLFNAIEVDAIGIDKRVAASDQFYRIRSFVGHPGFTAAVILAGMPLLMQVFWRRPAVMAAAMLAALTVLLLTFSRGSWLLGAVFFLPFILIRSRFWVRRNLKWLAPVALLPILFIAFQYWNSEKAYVEFEAPLVQQDMTWSKGGDGPIIPITGGIRPFNRFVYFDVDSDFASGDQGPVTVVIYYRDKGLGAVRVEYYSRDREMVDPATGLTLTPVINKTDSGEMSTAAFLLEDPVFDGLLNEDTDFRVVDDDNHITLERVELQRGKLKFLEVIKHQWLSRSSSVSTRAGLFPFAWDVFEENPWGVGMFNSPGTENHAVDSWPLTWLMEFGWLSFPLLLLLAGVLMLETVRAAINARGPATVLLLSMLLLLLHGGHLMILYDKPSIVMLSALTAIYATVRPWRRNGPDVELNSDDCAV